MSQEEKYQQRYLTSFKLALQIEEFHYWNWELMLSIFCRNCGSLLRPFFSGCGESVSRFGSVRIAVLVRAMAGDLYPS